MKLQNVIFLFLLAFYLFFHHCIGQQQEELLQKIFVDHGDVNGYPISVTSAHTPVRSNANKFLVPIPEIANAPELIYPSGEMKGQPLLDWRKNQVHGNGIVFFNGKDNSWQGVRANGREYIIFNNPTKSQAGELEALLRQHPPTTIQGVNTFLNKAAEMGHIDRYNTDREFVQGNLEQISGNLYRRNGEINHAIYVPGRGRFEGAAADSQQFDNGAVIVKNPKDTKGAARLIQPDIFQDTYTDPNGHPIDLSSLSRHEGIPHLPVVPPPRGPADEGIPPVPAVPPSNRFGRLGTAAGNFKRKTMNGFRWLRGRFG